MGLRVADRRFVGESLLGMVRRGSTMLTEIGRGLKEPSNLKHTEKRLSRMAKTEHFDDDRLRSNYLTEVGGLTSRELPYVAVDLSDITKRERQNDAAAAIWLFDRGFDGGYNMKTLLDLKLRWVVRMVGTRNVEFEEGPKRMDAGSACSCSSRLGQSRKSSAGRRR